MSKNLKLINYLFLFFWSINAAYAVRAEDLFQGKTSINNPLDLRDPFKSPVMEAESRADKSNYKTKTDGHYSNLPTMGKVKLDDVQIVGVLIGKNRSAIIKIKGDAKSSYILREGMKLGDNQAEVKAILPGGVILVERLTNIYGEEEYLETVIPISR